VLIGEKRWAEAVRMGRYASLFELRRNELLSLGAAAWHADDPEVMAETYARADADGDAEPLDAGQLNAYGLGLQGIGRWADLASIAERLRSLPGSEANGCDYLAWARLGEGRHAEAVELSRRAVKVNRDPAAAAEYKQNLARIQKNDLGTPRPLRRDVWRAANPRLVALLSAEHRGEGPSMGPSARGLELASSVLEETAGSTDPAASLARAEALRVWALHRAPVDPAPPLDARPAAAGDEEDDEISAWWVEPLRNAGLRDADLDERHLMPLSEARALVRGAEEFRRGEGRDLNGEWVWESDRLWAALLSLEDAEELLREVRRLRWFFHVRGQENIELVLRYGAVILPWLAEHVDEEGLLHNVPWCIAPCLVAIDAAGAFEALWRVRRIEDGIPEEGPGPFAVDADEHDTDSPRPEWLGETEERPGEQEAGAEEVAIDPEADKLVRDFVRAHPATGFAELARLAGEGDERAAATLGEMAARAPAEVRAHVEGILGAPATKRIWKRLALPESLTAQAILDELDAYAEGERATEFMAWPHFNTGIDGRWEYHALRLVAARAATGDGWGIAFERLSGCDGTNLCLRHYLYGSHVDEPGEQLPDMDAVPFEATDRDTESEYEEDYPDDIHGTVIRGPRAANILTEEDVERLDLRRGRTTEESSNPNFCLRLRACLAQQPGGFRSAARAVAAQLRLGDDAQVIVVSDAFEHALGTDGGTDRDDHDQAWCIPPSRSKTFQSLARALVARDGALFKPGRSNLDWRLHAIYGGDEDEG
jgi:hypothetical protein